MMRKNELSCMLCEGKIFHNEKKQSYTCSKCNTEHAPEMFSNISSKRVKFHVSYPKLKLFFAIIGALYLFYLTLRVFYY